MTRRVLISGVKREEIDADLLSYCHFLEQKHRLRRRRECQAKAKEKQKEREERGKAGESQR